MRQNVTSHCEPRGYKTCAPERELIRVAFERDLLRLLDDYLVGQTDFREFRTKYLACFNDAVGNWTHDYYASMPPDEWQKPTTDVRQRRLAELMSELMDSDRLEFFRRLRERIEWTSSIDPDPTDRKYGWRNREELVAFLQIELRSYRKRFGWWTQHSTWGGNYEKQSNGTVTKYYGCDGRRIAMPVVSGGTSTLSYLLSDQLGSTTGILDSAGNVVSTQHYFAYGSNRSGGTTDLPPKN